MLWSLGSRTEVVSSGPSAARAGGRSNAAAPIPERPARTRRRVSIIGIVSLTVCSPLQLAFKLVEETPVGVFGDHLVWGRFDEPGVAHAQRIEADRVLRVVFPPSVVWDVLKRLQRIVVARSEAAIDEQPRGTRRLARAKIRRLQDRAHRPLGRDRMPPNKLAIAREHAAEILRPRPVHCRVEDDATDLLCAQFLRLWWEAEERIDLALNKQIFRLLRRIGDPANVLLG